MRSWRALTFFAAVAAVSAMAVSAQDPGEDEKAVEAVGDKWVEAWNAGDLSAVAALYTQDADYTDVFGERFQGREAIEKAFTELHASAYQGTKLSLEKVSLRFVSPTVAVYDSRWKFTDVPEVEEGEPPPPSEGLSAAVLVKQGDQWLLSAHRSRVPYTPAAPAE